MISFDHYYYIHECDDDTENIAIQTPAYIVSNFLHAPIDFVNRTRRAVVNVTSLSETIKQSSSYIYI